MNDYEIMIENTKELENILDEFYLNSLEDFDWTVRHLEEILGVLFFYLPSLFLPFIASFSLVSYNSTTISLGLLWYIYITSTHLKN